MSERPAPRRAVAAGAIAAHTAPHVLRDYALVADGERGALIGPRGDVAWLCAPRWESDGVLSGLIGGPGTYLVAPAARSVWGGHYEDGTLVWRSRWVTDGGIVECREALAFPGDPRRVVLLRRVLAREGPARMRVALSLRAGFGRHGMTVEGAIGEAWTGRSGPLRWRWLGAAGARPLRLDGGARALALELEVPAGAHHDLVLEIGEAPPGELPDPDRLWSDTARAWRAAVPALSATLAPRDARQAVAVLRGLTAAGGGMVAAATMGLPERAEEGRNYDYRYVWIRDQCYAGVALAAAGAEEPMDRAVAFVAERLLADGPGLRPAYLTSGGAVPDEDPLGVPGYPGARAVRGNHANAQFQLDVFGEALLLLAAALRLDRLDDAGRRALALAAEAIAARWRDPDAGIWEIEDRPWTHSRLVCAAGLRAAAAALGPGGDETAWLRLADKILADTSARALHPSGRWQRAPDDPRVDAALLLPAVRGALPVGDPRTAATLAGVLADLTEDGYAYRFRQDERPLGQAEGAFLLCGFSVALAARHAGDDRLALRWFERNRAACGFPGLFAEEYDVEQRQLRGNLPQAFVHALLLECAARLAEPASQDVRPAPGG